MSPSVCLCCLTSLSNAIDALKLFKGFLSFLFFFKCLMGFLKGFSVVDALKLLEGFHLSVLCDFLRFSGLFIWQWILWLVY
jgi:hypothetical protein